MGNYLQSKAGSAWLADEFAKRLGSKGVLSIVSKPEFGRIPLADQRPEHTSRINEDRAPEKLGFLHKCGYGMFESTNGADIC